MISQDILAHEAARAAHISGLIEEAPDPEAMAMCLSAEYAEPLLAAVLGRDGWRLPESTDTKTIAMLRYAGFIYIDTPVLGLWGRAVRKALEAAYAD